MEIIAVDGDRYALKSTAKAIKKAVPDCILSSFGMPGEAIVYAREHRVDVAFLNIEKEVMGNALILAKNLKEIYGYTNIFFVTGSPEFAKSDGDLFKPVTARAVAWAMGRLWWPVMATGETTPSTFGVH